ncbi:unnamed protein product [Ectocarpus sp. CCAP 1310/34]|nr:unnamed protein product [Ectocarpus sp. CCAP 1310/34]
MALALPSAVRPRSRENAGGGTGCTSSSAGGQMSWSARVATPRSEMFPRYSLMSVLVSVIRRVFTAAS